MEHEDSSTDKTKPKSLIITSGSSSENSLTEPISETIKRDLDVVISKLKFFFIQQKKKRIKHQRRNKQI